MAKAPQKKPAPPKDVVEIIDCEQRSAEWFQARLGIVTASNFAIVLASGTDGGASKTRAALMRQLAGEIVSGETAETFRNKAMERGIEMEPEAREHYSRTNLAELHQVGFVKRTFPNGDVVGASPDSLIVGTRGGLEIKTTRPDLLIEQMQRGTPPTEHRAQLHGTMWVADLDWMDLVLFYRGMPALRFKYERDDVFIRELAERVEVFNYELRKLVEWIRSRG